LERASARHCGGAPSGQPWSIWVGSPMRWGRPGDLAQVPAGFFVLRCNVAMAVSIFRDIRRNRILPSNWIVAQLVLILILILILIWMLWRSTFLHLVAAHPTAARIASKHAIFLVGFDWGGDGGHSFRPRCNMVPQVMGRAGRRRKTCRRSGRGAPMHEAGVRSNRRRIPYHAVRCLCDGSGGLLPVT
jgi:hypothetical protein